MDLTQSKILVPKQKIRLVKADFTFRKGFLEGIYPTWSQTGIEARQLLQGSHAFQSLQGS